MGVGRTHISHSHHPTLTAPTTPTIHQYSGLFILGMRACHYIAQTKVKDVEVKKAMTAAAGAVWGACGLLTLSTWAEGKTPNLFVNFGLQVFFTGAYAHQYMTMGSAKKD